MIIEVLNSLLNTKIFSFFFFFPIQFIPAHHTPCTHNKSNEPIGKLSQNTSASTVYSVEEPSQPKM